MPYRRLPNTDAARLRAMEAAFAMGKELHPKELAYTQETYGRLGLFINSFSEAIQHYRIASEQQAESSHEYQEHTRNARLYVSHFIQVVNMAILRGELKPETREYYGLPKEETKLPSLTADQEVVEWGKRIIDGEATRMGEGKSPIMNPTIAMVRVQYEQFFDVYTRQKVLQQNTARTLCELNELRQTADTIILSVWNEVERTFSSLPPHEGRERAKQYGVHYVYRKNELKDTVQPEDTLLSPATVKAFEDFSRE